MTAAADLPVARVVVDSPLPHLDRLFDYSVPPELDEAAQPGVRVKVRFSGRLVAGFLLERTAAADRALQGRLSPLASVVSPEQVLTPEVARLARASPTATPAPSPTCCASPCRRGTPGSRRRPAPELPAARPAAAVAGAAARTTRVWSCARR